MKIKNVFDLIFSMENLYGALEDASREGDTSPMYWISTPMPGTI